MHPPAVFRWHWKFSLEAQNVTHFQQEPSGGQVKPSRMCIIGWNVLLEWEVFLCLHFIALFTNTFDMTEVANEQD